MSANPDVERYAAQVQQMSARISELEKGERVARYHAKLSHMAEVDGYPIDTAEEIVRCQDYSQAQFDQHVSDIVKYGSNSRLPVGPGVRPMAAPNPMAANGKRMNKEQAAKAFKYMQDNPGKSHTEAIQYAMNGDVVR